MNNRNSGIAITPTRKRVTGLARDAKEAPHSSLPTDEIGFTRRSAARVFRASVRARWVQLVDEADAAAQDVRENSELPRDFANPARSGRN